MAYRKRSYRKKKYTRKKRYYQKKGKQLHGYKLSTFIYPYLVFIVSVFWLFSLVLAGLSLSLTPWLWLLAGPAVLMSLTLTYQWWRQRRILNQAQTIEMLRQMDPIHFEYYVANLLKRLGFSAKVTKASGDFGVDVVAYKKRKKYVVQCKRYAEGNLVTSPEMQQFIGSIQIYKADAGMFVATSTYTADARKLAAKLGVTLIDETKLAELISKAYPRP